MADDPKRIIIVGAGSQGTVVADALERAVRTAIGFVDDTPAAQGTSVLGLPILGVVNALSAIDHDAIVVAIGDNAARRELTERLVAGGERITTSIHPFSYVSPGATVGEGAMISAGALVLPRAVIGRGVLLNTKASVDHDSVIGDFSHIAPGATVGGRVVIGAGTLIAAGATVATGKRVGSWTVIGAGAVVVADIGDSITAVGVPARPRS